MIPNSIVSVISEFKSLATYIEATLTIGGVIIPVSGFLADYHEFYLLIE